MQVCRICAESLKEDEKSRGTCKDCESEIAKNFMQKMIKGYFPKKLRVKA